MDDLAGLGKVHIVTGGNHGGGLSRIYKITNAAHSSDDIEILKDTALKLVINGLKKIHDGGHFILEEGENSKLAQAFEQMEDNGARVLCNLPLHIFNGKSSSCCMWCKSRPSEWRPLCHEKGAPVSDETSLWTTTEHMSYLNQIANKRMKEAKDKKVSSVNLSFLSLNGLIIYFLILQFEIGTVIIFLTA